MWLWQETPEWAIAHPSALLATRAHTERPALLSARALDIAGRLLVTIAQRQSSTYLGLSPCTHTCEHRLRRDVHAELAPNGRASCTVRPASDRIESFCFVVEAPARHGAQSRSYTVRLRSPMK